VCLEEFTYNADGSIPTIASTTAGPKAIANLNPYLKTEAETIAWESGVTTEVCSEGGMDVTSISSGDYIKVKNVDFGTGATSFTARVAASAAGGTIQIRLGSQTGTLVGTCNVSATGGTQTWANTTCTVSGASGVNDLFFVFGGSTFNFNNWQFTGSGGGASGTGGASSTGGVSSNGGVPATGGTATAGGTRATGGSSSPGGSRATGGSTGGLTTGGAAAVGGTLTSGGAVSTGGSRAAGGTTSASNTGGSSTVAANGGSVSTGGAANVTGGIASITGGAANNIGGSATGGLVGAGGALAIGGAPVSGGFVGTAGATTSETAGTTSSTDSSNSGSCSCRVNGGHSPSKSLAAFGLLGLLFLRSVRKRPNRSGSHALPRT